MAIMMMEFSRSPANTIISYQGERERGREREEGREKERECGRESVCVRERMSVCLREGESESNFHSELRTSTIPLALINERMTDDQDEEQEQERAYPIMVPSRETSRMRGSNRRESIE